MIKLITVGKIKEKYLKDAILEYTKRISKYTKLEIIELQDYDYDNKQIVLEKEKENIIKHINPRDYVITMQIEGKNISSEDFADKIDKVFVTNPNIVFIIGGSYGLHDDIKKEGEFTQREVFCNS